jgi:FK506-binding protein 4/5
LERELLYEDKKKEFYLEDKEVFEALEELVTNMRRKEVAEAKVRAIKAFGSKGNEEMNVKPNETIYLWANLIDYEELMFDWDMSPKQKLERSTVLKNQGTFTKIKQGNKFFGEKKYNLAQKRYDAVLMLLKNANFNEEEKEENKNLIVSCNNNISQIHLLNKKYKEVIVVCNKVLGMDYKNVKALYRRAKAYQYMEDFEKSKADLNEILLHEPNNLEAKKLINEMNRIQKERDEKDRIRFKNIF